MSQVQPKHWVINSHRGMFKTGQLENSAQSYLDALREGANMLKCGVKFCPRVPDDPGIIAEYVQAGVDGFETDNVPFIRDCISRAGFELPPIPNI